MARRYTIGTRIRGIQQNRAVWLTWDWSQSNAALASAHLLSGERVRQIRKLLNIPTRPRRRLELAGFVGRQYDRARYSIDKERLKARQRDYYRRNQESHTVRARLWRLSNPERMEAYKAKSRTGPRKSLKRSCPAIWAMIAAEKRRDWRRQNRARLTREHIARERKNPALTMARKAKYRARVLRASAADNAIRLLFAASQLSKL